MEITKDWPGKDTFFTDKQRVNMFKKLLASREKLSVYNEAGIKQNAGTEKYARTVELRDRNIASIERLKKKIEYYSDRIK